MSHPSLIQGQEPNHTKPPDEDPISYIPPSVRFHRQIEGDTDKGVRKAIIRGGLYKTKHKKPEKRHN